MLACLMVCMPRCSLSQATSISENRDITRKIRTTESQIQSILQESIQHRAILKTLEHCEAMVNKLNASQQELRERIRHRTQFSSTSSTILSSGFSIDYLVTFLWGVNRQQEGSITYGTMIAFIQLIGQIQGPFRKLTRYIPTVINSLTASERLMELQETPLEPEGEPNMLSGNIGVKLQNVSFSYSKDKREVIKKLNFDFLPGSTTAILGETDAGKATLIRLILALLKPCEGSIYLYNKEGKCIPASAHTRCNLVYVPQGNTLFSGTIRDNLKLDDANASEKEMLEALETACARFVMELPEGLDAPCGELGAGLNEGQAQRIAIARALLRKGNILLLDEATSSLDPITEKQLLQHTPQRRDGILHATAVTEKKQRIRLKEKKGFTSYPRSFIPMP